MLLTHAQSLHPSKYVVSKTAGFKDSTNRMISSLKLIQKGISRCRKKILELTSPEQYERHLERRSSFSEESVDQTSFLTLKKRQIQSLVTNEIECWLTSDRFHLVTKKNVKYKGFVPTFRDAVVSLLNHSEVLKQQGLQLEQTNYLLAEAVRAKNQSIDKLKNENYTKSEIIDELRTENKVLRAKDKKIEDVRDELAKKNILIEKLFSENRGLKSQLLNYKIKVGMNQKQLMHSIEKNSLDPKNKFTANWEFVADCFRSCQIELFQKITKMKDQEKNFKYPQITPIESSEKVTVSVLQQAANMKKYVQGFIEKTKEVINDVDKVREKFYLMKKIQSSEFELSEDEFLNELSNIKARNSNNVEELEQQLKSSGDIEKVFVKFVGVRDELQKMQGRIFDLQYEVGKGELLGSLSDDELEKKTKELDVTKEQMSILKRQMEGMRRNIVSKKSCLPPHQELIKRSLERSLLQRKSRKKSLGMGLSSNKCFVDRTLEDYRIEKRIYANTHTDCSIFVGSLKGKETSGQDLDKKVLVKCLPCSTEEQEKQLMNDITIFGGLENTHVVKMNSIFTYLDRLTRKNFVGIEMDYLQMNYLDWLKAPNTVNKNTHIEFIRSKNRRTRKEIKEVMRQLVLGLLHIHSRGISHKNISPGSLMINEDASGKHIVKLVDFSISESQSSKFFSTQKGRVIPGSGKRYNYHGEFRDGKIHDIYSFGLVLYESLIDPHLIPAEYPSNPSKILIPKQWSFLEKEILGQCLIAPQKVSFEQLVTHAFFGHFKQVQKIEKSIFHLKQGLQKTEKSLVEEELTLKRNVQNAINERKQMESLLIELRKKKFEFQKEKQKISSMVEDQTCCICLDRKNSIQFSVCKHVCCCEQCSEYLRDCPICKLRINSKIKLKNGLKEHDVLHDISGEIFLLEI